MEVQRLIADNGHEHIRFDGHVHDVPPIPEGVTAIDEPVAWCESAYKALWDGMDALKDIGANQRLSQLGKEEQMLPHQVKLLENPAKLHSALNTYEVGLDKQEGAIYALPELHPTATVLGQREVEIRNWFRGLSLEERHKVRQTIQDGSAGAEIEIALMRSPIAHIDADGKILTEAWRARKRSENLAEAARVEALRAAVDRARRINGFIHAVTLNHLVRWDRKQVLKQLLTSDNEYARRGYKGLGFSDTDAANMQMWLDGQKRIAERAR